jgi:hypothetical protein
MTASTPNNLPAPEPLSPAAQEVRIDISKIWLRLQSHCKVDYCPGNPLSITIETSPVGLTTVINNLVSAALCAAADQVVPEEPLFGGDQRWMFQRDARQISRKKLIAIATELEGE